MKRLLWLAFIFPLPALADVIDAKKNDLVRIHLDQEDSLAPGDRVFSLDSSGKKKGIIKIEKVKGVVAFGRVQKGKAEKDMTIQPARAASKTKTETASASPKKRKRSGDRPLSLGVFAGIGFDSMTVKLATPAGEPVETLNMSGTGFSGKAILDYNFTSYLGIRLLVGLEQLNATGTASAAVCEGTVNCKTEISYITTDGWIRYAIVDGDSKIWLGAGFGVLMPGSKTTNTLDEASISTTSAIYFGAGYDIFVDDDMFIPLQADYAILPSSDQVSASIIAVRAGVGFRF